MKTLTTSLIGYTLLIHNAFMVQAKKFDPSSATSLDVRLDSNAPKSRSKRSIIFPTGSDLTFDVGLSIPIGIFSKTSNEHDFKQHVFIALLTNFLAFLDHFQFMAVHTKMKQLHNGMKKHNNKRIDK